MGGCCCSCRKAHLHGAPCPPVLEEQESLRSLDVTASTISAGLLVHWDPEASIPDTYRPPPPPLPYDMVFGCSRSTDSDSARETISCSSFDTSATCGDLGESDCRVQESSLAISPKKLELSKSNEPHVLEKEDEDVCPICLEVDFTTKELKKLRVKQRYPFRDQQYNGKYPIITFEEFISIALDSPRVVGIYPEIKNPVLINQHVKWADGKRFEDRFVETLKKYGYKGSYLSKDWLKQPAFIQSFAPTSLVYVSNLTDLPKIFLIDDVTVPTQDTNQSYWEITSDPYLDYIKDYVVGIGPWKDTIVPVVNNYLQTPTDLVSRAHAHDLQVHPYTYRNENSFLHLDFHQDPYAEYNYWINEIGVDGLFTDFTGSLHNFQEWTSFNESDDKNASSLLHQIASMVSPYKKA